MREHQDTGRHEAHRRELQERVRVDLPRITPDQMVTTQQSVPRPDPTGGRDHDADIVLRYAGF